MQTVGFLYPGHAAEDDYPLAERLLGGDVALPVQHTYGEDLHAVAELLALGGEQKLADGARELLARDDGRGASAVVWACTSGSFVFGPEGAQQQVERLAAASGLPASSTSFAFVRAAGALGLRRVAVAASYPDDVAKLFVEFLGSGGVDVVSMSSQGIDTAAEVGDLGEDAVAELVLGHDHPDADALLVPDTAMRTLALIGRLEDRLGKPVLTANQVTIWEGLRIAGAARGCDRLGTLFRGGA